MLQTQSDERLLELTREGHELAFEVLVQRHRKSLLLHSERLLAPSARAEDAVQQGLLQAWIALRRGAEVREVRPWLYRIVRNAALKMLRANGHEHALLSESLEGRGTPDCDPERAVATRQLLADVAALPPLQQAALLQTALGGQSYEQAATMLGLSDASVRGLVHRARRALRAASSAVIPLPRASWAANAARHGVPLSERLSALGAGASSGAVLPALVKGGAALVTAGALLAAGAALHRKPPVHNAPMVGAARLGGLLLAAAARDPSAASDALAHARGPAGAIASSRRRTTGAAAHTPASLIGAGASGYVPASASVLGAHSLGNSSPEASQNGRSGAPSATEAPQSVADAGRTVLLEEPHSSETTADPSSSAETTASTTSAPSASSNPTDTASQPPAELSDSSGAGHPPSETTADGPAPVASSPSVSASGD